MPRQIFSTSSAPAAVTETLRLLGRHIVVARTRRGLRQVDLARKAGVAPLTLARVEKGSPTTSIGAYLAALWAMGLDGQFANLASPDQDEEGKTLELARSPRRVDVKRSLDADF
jgi:transcriptional regulator with XRE-family HTH domain